MRSATRPTSREQVGRGFVVLDAFVGVLGAVFGVLGVVGSWGLALMCCSGHNQGSCGEAGDEE
jgi:hypothetical protein